VRTLKNKAQKWTMEAADDTAASFPVPLRGLDSDSGGEFIKRGTFALSGSVEEQPAFQRLV
jgi:hypothetical protein